MFVESSDSFQAVSHGHAFARVYVCRSLIRERISERARAVSRSRQDVRGRVSERV